MKLNIDWDEFDFLCSSGDLVYVLNVLLRHELKMFEE